ncbi:MAG: hypothetical protein AABX33_05410 [Nanoarchaeota archaeon]
MFEEYRDKRLVEKELKEILGREPTDYERKTFLAMFLDTYRNTRYMYTEKYHGNNVDNLIRNLIFGAGMASSTALHARITKWRPEDQTEKVVQRVYHVQRVYQLGQAFGYILAVVEYGLTSKILIGNEEKLDRVKREILNCCAEMVNAIKRMNSSVELKFIRNRILGIAVKLRIKGVSKHQEDLIFGIAHIFQ